MNEVFKHVAQIFDFAAEKLKREKRQLLNKPLSQSALKAASEGALSGYFPGDDGGPEEDDGLFPPIF